MTLDMLAEKKMETKQKYFLKQFHAYIAHFLFIYGRSKIQKFWNLSQLI